MHDRSYIRLPLKKAYNVRDLGGYACNGKAETRWHTFLRADGLSHLDQRDIDFLLDYGVKNIIDLRSPQELQAEPNVLANYPNVSYSNINLMVGELADFTRAKGINPYELMPKFYLNLLENAQDKFYSVFSLFAQQDGCTLFHCTAGKDRTGLTTMLLLDLVGVSTADIIANYMVTYTYLKEGPLADVSDKRRMIEFNYSLPEYLIPSINYIMENYGNAESYLKSIGISDGQIDRIRKRFVRP